MSTSSPKVRRGLARPVEHGRVDDVVHHRGRARDARPGVEAPVHRAGAQVERLEAPVVGADVGLPAGDRRAGVDVGAGGVAPALAPGRGVEPVHGAADVPDHHHAARHAGAAVEAPPDRGDPPAGARVLVQRVDGAGVVAHHHGPARQGRAALDRAGRPEGPAQAAVLGVDGREDAGPGAEVDRAVDHQRRALDRAVRAVGPAARPVGQAVGRHDAVHRDDEDPPVGDRRGGGDVAAVARLPDHLAGVDVQREDAAAVRPEDRDAVLHRRRELDQRARVERPPSGAAPRAGGSTATAGTWRVRAGPPPYCGLCSSGR